MILKGVNPLSSTGIFRSLIFITGFLAIDLNTRAQAAPASDSSLYLTLDQCVDYAFKHQPALAQSNINISITKLTNSIALSGWLPQVNLTGSITHYNSLPTNFISDTAHPGTPIRQQ